MSLPRFILSRIGALAVTLLIASMVIFSGLYFAPGSPLTFLTGGRTLPPATIAAIKAQYHLDQPMAQQYLSWLGGVLHGNFGQSIIYRQNVITLIAPQIATTSLLLLYTTVLVVAIGVGMGLLSAARKGVLDSLASIGSSIGLAIPAFVAAIVLMTVLANDFGWFPVQGPGTGLPDMLWHLSLPALSLAITTSAFVMRITRTAAREELASDHVDTARGRGIPGTVVLRRHVTRNALIPITTAVGLSSASLIAGSIIVDQAFALNGLGSSLVTAVNAHDYPVVQAITLIMVGAFVIINTIIDALYPLIDPRIGFGKQFS